MTLLNACCNLVRESRRQAIYLPGAKVLIRLSDKRDSSRNCKQNRRIKSINPGKRLYGTNSWWDNCEPRVLIDSTSRAVGVGNRACVGRDSSRTRLQGCNLHEGGTLVSTRSSACASIRGPCGRLFTVDEGGSVTDVQMVASDPPGGVRRIRARDAHNLEMRRRRRAIPSFRGDRFPTAVAQRC